MNYFIFKYKMIDKLNNNELLTDEELNNLLYYVLNLNNIEETNKIYKLLIQHEYFIFNKFYRNGQDKYEYLMLLNKIMKICYNKLNKEEFD